MFSVESSGKKKKNPGLSKTGDQPCLAHGPFFFWGWGTVTHTNGWVGNEYFSQVREGMLATNVHYDSQL